MKILLLNPPSSSGAAFIREGRCMQRVDSWAAPWPPLSLAILAAIARRHGEVTLVDYAVETLAERGTPAGLAASLEPDIIVLNTGFPSIEDDAAAARAAKTASPSSMVAGFGVFFTMLGEESMRAFPVFDAGIYGEPEDTFDDLCRALKDGADPAGIPGLMLRRSGEIVSGPVRPFTPDLDLLPRPARDLLPNDRYILPHNGEPFTLLNTARGCPQRCTFCITPAYYGRKMRRHSIDYILEEIDECRNAFGIGHFLFWEETFTRNRGATLDFCAALGRLDPPIAWAATTRADRVDDELASAMKSAGCFMLGLGIESASRRILDQAGKEQDISAIPAAVDACRKVGILAMGHFIFGLPGETPGTVEKTISFALSLDLDYLQCYPAVPYPGTPLGDEAIKKGWVTTRRWRDYDFGGASVLDTGSISPAEVDAARARLFRKFYLRPRYIARQITALGASPARLRGAGRFFKWMKHQRRPGDLRPAERDPDARTGKPEI